MKTITLALLTSDIRVLSGLKDSQFLTDAEILRLINASIYAFTGRLLAMPGADYFEKKGTAIAVTSATDTYDLPADCFELKYATYTTGGVIVKLKQYSIGDFSIDATGVTWELYRAPGFRLIGNSIKLIPAPTSSFSLYPYYIPYLPGCFSSTHTAITALSTSTDYLDEKWGFGDWIKLDVAALIMDLQEEDSKALRERQNIRWAEIEKSITTRAQYTPKRLPEPKRATMGMIGNEYSRRW